MKFRLLLITALLGFTASAHTITVKIIEGWKSTPLENSEVTLTSVTGQIVKTGKTDVNGIVVFERIRNGKYNVSATDDSGNFNNTSSESRLKVKSETHVQLILYPTADYVRERKAEEDKIYGTIEPRKNSTETEEEQDEKKEELDEEEYTDTLIDAEFPGGTLKMRRFIQENVVYPEISRELGDQGRIYLEFVVEPDGVITHVSCMRKLTPALEREAERLIRAMPNWITGTVAGVKVRSKCRLPITFTLE